MGAFSRKVVPVCGRLCIFCPALRPRSKQAVKRYKKLIADIFHTPRHQEEAPNDRKIGKLCEYAAKNAVRMPEISDLLEQRCYKELRNENFHSAKIVMCIYRRLLVTCNEQMPLFSSGFLRTVQALLDQTRQVEMQIVGCQSLFEFVNNQTDGSSLFSLEGVLSKLCQLALEVGDDDRSRSLRAAGLQALSAMIWLMGEYSHIPSDFDNVVSGVLENYGHPKKLANAIDNARKWVDEVLKNEGHLAHADSLINVPSWRTVVNNKGELNVKMEDSLDPSFWSKICLHNMAKLGEDATTMRRILESLFRYFDEGHLWSTENSIALPVLRDLQFLMELSGQRTHFILSMLIKHLDHKSVLKQPSMQLNILEVTSSLAENAKVEHSAAIVSAISDIMRHLRKCMHSSLDESNLPTEVANCNRLASVAVDKCLVQLIKKVGDAGPILDAMAVMLENISAVTDVARTTMAAVFRTAQIIASIPNLSYQNKAFPEALFHQLLQAMVHPDHKTRIGAHRIFSVVLVPTSVCPRPSSTTTELKKGMGLPRSLSRNASVFSSSAALFEKLRKDKVSSVLTSDQSQNEILDRIKSSYGQAYSSWNQSVDSVADNSELDAVCIRLSSHQIGLLLSSLWAQSISPANTPENYEAIANTYSLVLLFSGFKNSSHDALIRSFQMALSLRDISLMEGGPLPPSRRRSLFTLATSMVLFSSKAFNLFSLADITKVALQGPTLDPFLHLVEDHKLKAVNPDQLHIVAYGTEEDDASALDTLSKIAVSTEHSRGTLVYEIVKSLENMCSSEMEKMQEQLLTEFMPDDACPLGTRFLEDTQTSFQADFGDVKHQNLAALFSHEDQEFGNVTETVAADASYKEMTLHCEDLLTGKQQKISSLFNSQLRHKSSVNGSPGQHDKEIKIATFLPMINSAFHTETQCYSELQAYKLPASTPYDNFLKAAGC
ncbi:hypothetical protein YC2023_063851 [Brassica napus]